MGRVVIVLRNLFNPYFWQARRAIKERRKKSKLSRKLMLEIFEDFKADRDENILNWMMAVGDTFPELLKGKTQGAAVKIFEVDDYDLPKDSSIKKNWSPGN